MTYLIGDVQRRHGTLVVHAALSCVRSDDEALLIEVAAHRSLRTLRPSLLAPTVLACQAEPAVVLDALRAAGYMPAPAPDAGSIEGGVIELGRHAADRFHDDDESPVRMVDHLRELDSRSPIGHSDEVPADVRELAAAILSAAGGRSGTNGAREPSAAEAMIETFGAHLDPVERRQLAYAVDNQLPVRITYQSASGGITTRTISDIELVSGLMYAWCHLREDERAFSVDRVRAVLPVDNE